MKSKTQRGPGRPMAEIKIPNGKFTFADLAEANSHVTPLTLRKFLKRDMFVVNEEGKVVRPRKDSTVVIMKDETREPNSKKGLGRKTFVYIRRSKANAVKSVARKSTVSVTLAEPVAAPVAETPTPEVIAAEVAPVVAEATTPDSVTA